MKPASQPASRILGRFKKRAVCQEAERKATDATDVTKSNGSKRKKQLFPVTLRKFRDICFFPFLSSTFRFSLLLFILAASGCARVLSQSHLAIKPVKPGFQIISQTMNFGSGVSIVGGMRSEGFIGGIVGGSFVSFANGYTMEPGVW